MRRQPYARWYLLIRHADRSGNRGRVIATGSLDYFPWSKHRGSWCIGRAVEHLPVTHLEIVTLAYVATSFVISSGGTTLLIFIVLFECSENWSWERQIMVSKLVVQESLSQERCSSRSENWSQSNRNWLGRRSAMSYKCYLHLSSMLRTVVSSWVAKTECQGLGLIINIHRLYILVRSIASLVFFSRLMLSCRSGEYQVSS